MRSLETEPEDRYATTWDFGQALVDSVDGPARDELRTLLR
jgi:hypothetical protein